MIELESIEWLRVFILDYPLLHYLVLFFGPLIGGEVSIIVLAFLSAQGVISLLFLVILSFLAIFLADAIWFFLGRTAVAQRIISHRHISPTSTIIFEAVRRVSKGNHLVALVLAKLMPGTRILMIMYMSKSDLVFRKFVLYNAVATLFWLFIVISIGFISGAGYTYLAEIFKNLYLSVGFVFLVAIIIITIHLWIKKQFIH